MGTIIKRIVLAAVVLCGIFVYMLVTHPFMMNHMFGDSPSQEQVEKEWNKPVVPHVCYTADCRR
jgi:hypothetical protein